MVTARRSNENVNSSYDVHAAKGGVDLLERPRTYNEYTAPVAPKSEEYDAQKERMQRNLDKLLNYDRYAEQQAEIEAEVNNVKDVATTSLADEDIRPTSTTMQFGEDIDQIREEMKQSSTIAIDETSSYRLNVKGKLAVILYSLAITVILALIVLNTGVLARLSKSNTVKAAELNETIAKYDAIQTQIDSISNSDYVVNVATNEYGMVKK